MLKLILIFVITTINGGSFLEEDIIITSLIGEMKARSMSEFSELEPLRVGVFSSVANVRNKGWKNKKTDIENLLRMI